MITLNQLEAGLLDQLFSIRPITEMFIGEDDFTSWRLSWGLKSKEPFVCYLSIYPAFCRDAKATFHYSTAGELFTAIKEIELMNIPLISDAVATVFAISRGKESFELFQEQKLLMDLGLRHFCLDNYYQEQIRKFCLEYFDTFKINGSPFNLNNILVNHPCLKTRA